MANSLQTIEPKVGFSKTELSKIQEYVKQEGLNPLPPHVLPKMFESYLSGSSLSEVAKLNSEFSSSAILYSAYQYNWPAMRDEIVMDLQERVKQKVLYSKFQQLELVGDMIQVAHAEAHQVMQAYIKNPSERNLPKILRIKNIRDLSMAIEMMSQIIGQDQHKSISVTGNITSNPTPGTPPPAAGMLTEATAAALIKSMNKKKKGNNTTNAEIIDGEVVK